MWISLVYGFIRTSRTVCKVQKKTSLYCNVAKSFFAIEERKAQDLYCDTNFFLFFF